MSERIHLYEVIEPAPRGGPGRSLRARVAEPGGPLAVGAIVHLRIVSASRGSSLLTELAEEHAAARDAVSPSLCSPADFGVVSDADGERFWSVSPWREGRTLAAMLADAASIPDPLVEEFTRQVANALRACHRAGLAAIGLSPETVLVAEDASVLVLDPGFGAAVAASWPQSGSVCASLACAAPEAIRDRARADERADLFSLGATLHRAMTGRWHRPDDAQALRCEPESFAARRPSEAHSRLSTFLDELVFALLEPHPSARIASSEELAKVLHERRGSTWWKERRPADDRAAGDERPASDGRPSSDGRPASDGRPSSDRRPASEVHAAAPRPAETPAPALPQPAAPLGAGWIAERRVPRVRLARHPARLVGRDEELRALVEASLRFPENGGEVHLIQGDAGMGKTRLVDAWLEALAALPRGEAPLVLVGEHRRLGIGRPMRGFSEAITRLVAQDREVAAEQIAPLLADAVAIAPAFAAFLSGREPPPRAATMTREGLTAAFAQCLSQLARTAPVVLVIENLQWADPEGLDLFGHLARLAPEMPLFLVATYRPAVPDSRHEQLESSLRLDHVVKTRLEPLTPAETRAVCEELVAPGSTTARLAARIHDASNGVPRAVVETLRVFEAEGVLEHGPAGVLRVADRAASLRPPATEQETWTRRLGLLPASARAMLAGAGVQGYAFDADVVRRTLRLSVEEADAAWRVLSEGWLVEGEGVALTFANHSLFDFVHDEYDDAALEALHEAAANAFLASRDPDHRPPSEVHGILAYRVAWHFMLAGKPARGVPYVEPALRHLRQTWRLGDAERLAGLVVLALANEPTRTAELVDMMLCRADILGLQGRRDEQSELLHEALLACREKGEPVREARVLLETARHRFAMTEYDDALAEGRDALAAAQRAKDEHVESQCQALLGAVAFREARYQDARNHVREMLRLARRGADPSCEAEALHTLGTISQNVGSFEHAEELHRGAMEIYRRQGDLPHEADALASLGAIAASAGDRARAEDLLRRALAIERAVGDVGGEARVLGRLAILFRDAQRSADAIAAHIECLGAARRTGSRHSEAVALLNLATLEYGLGKVDDARADHGEAMRIARELSDNRFMGYALTGLGDIARQCGETLIARGLFERAVTEFRRTDDGTGLSGALLGAGRLAMLSGDGETAATLLREAHELASVRGSRGVAALSLSLAGLVAARAGRSTEALGHLRSAALAAGSRDRDLVQAEVRFVHALVHRVLGRRAEADRRMLEAEAVLLDATAALPDEDRDRVFAVMSPHREIAAGAALAREAQKSHRESPSDAISV